MNIDEYLRYDALGLAELVANGDVTADELTAIARAAVAKVNPELNAIAGSLDPAVSGTPDDGARFVGVPTFMKDLGAGIAGVPQHMGSRLCEGYTPAETSYFAERLLAAGFNVIGRTTCPEFGLTLTTESMAAGRSANPWNTDHICGGSSGGSAALVAAGVVPLAHTNDGGGSTRIPASICGNVGLKTSRGRVSLSPGMNDVTGPLIAEGCNSRTVRDTAAFLDAVAGSAPGEATTLPPQEHSFLDGLDNHDTYRIALSLDPWGDAVMHPDIRAEMERIGGVLRDLGHEVELATPSILTDGIVTENFQVLWFSLAQLTIDQIAPLTNRQPGPDTLEPMTRLMAEQGEKISALDFNKAIGASNVVGRSLGQFFDDWDLLLTPTLNQPTPTLGSDLTLHAGNTIEDWYHAALQVVPHTPVANFTGLPAISVPCGTGPGGLPLGAHFFGAMGQEATLLDVAAQLEEADPWRDRRPVVFAA